MKRWLLLALMCCCYQAMANMPFSFARRPPAQSMLQANTSASPQSSALAKAQESSTEQPKASLASSDVSSLVTVDEPSSKASFTPEPANTQQSQQKKALEKPVTRSQAPSRWESIQPQGTQQDDTFVVTNPEPALLAGQVSALEQGQSALTDKLTQQQEDQSDQVSELTIKVVQMKRAVLMLSQVVKVLAKEQEKAQSAPKKPDSFLSRQWLGVSGLGWFLIALGALFVLLLIYFWIFSKQTRAASLTRYGVFLCIAESHVVLGEAQSAKRLLKQVLSRGSAEEKARAAVIMAKLV